MDVDFWDVEMWRWRCGGERGRYGRGLIRRRGRVAILTGGRGQVKVWTWTCLRGRGHMDLDVDVDVDLWT